MRWDWDDVDECIAEWEEGCRRRGRVARKSYRGDTLAFQVQVLQPPPSCSAPQNLTGWFLQSTAKYSYADQDSQAVAIAKSTGVFPNIITFPNGLLAGLIQVSFGPLNTITFADGPTRLQCDIKAIDPSGNVTTIEPWEWLVLPTATRATTPS
jgi:hypothetical protein